jgi:hypothetical protein
MTEDSSAADRIAELEAEVEALREQVSSHKEVVSLLAASADSDAVPAVDCPYCDEEPLETEQGITWQQVTCPSCDFATYL